MNAVIANCLYGKTVAVAVSGAGPTILAVGKRALADSDIPQGFADWRRVELSPSIGAVLK